MPGAADSGPGSSKQEARRSIAPSDGIIGGYASGGCDDNVATWQCGAWARDGGVVATCV